MTEPRYFPLQNTSNLGYHMTYQSYCSLEKVVSTAQPPQESVDRFLKASEELMHMGESFSGNIDEALEAFKLRLEAFLKSNFLEKAVAEMLAHSFSEFEREIRTNLDGINRICTEGGQWYAFCLGSALGRQVRPPGGPEQDQKAKARSAS